MKGGGNTSGEVEDGREGEASCSMKGRPTLFASGYKALIRSSTAAL